MTDDEINFDLNGKVAIITGASRGIGKAIAKTYARNSAKVVLISRTQEDLDTVAKEITEEGGDALPLATHVGKMESIKKTVATILEEYGGIDILVNNAGTNPHFGPILTSEESHWMKTFDVNVMGYFRMVQAVFESMKERGGGKIINMSSVAGKKPQPGMGVYCVSKAGVIMLTQVLAVELAGHGIQVNAIAPGFVKTKFSSVLWQNDSFSKPIKAATPQGRIAESHEIAGIALYMASSASNFMTGETVVVDGGLLNSGISLPS